MDAEFFVGKVIEVKVLPFVKLIFEGFDIFLDGEDLVADLIELAKSGILLRYYSEDVAFEDIIESLAAEVVEEWLEFFFEVEFFAFIDVFLVHDFWANEDEILFWLESFCQVKFLFESEFSDSERGVKDFEIFGFAILSCFFGFRVSVCLVDSRYFEVGFLVDLVEVSGGFFELLFEEGSFDQELLIIELNIEVFLFEFVEDIGVNGAFASEGADEIDFFGDFEAGWVEFFVYFLKYFLVFLENLFGLFKLIGFLFVEKVLVLVEFVLVNDLLGVLDEEYKMFLNGQKSTFLVFYS